MDSLPTPPYFVDERRKEEACPLDNEVLDLADVSSLPPDSPWHRDEAKSLLQDLANFIALGCLTSQYELLPNGHPLESTDSQARTELHSCPLHPDLDQYRNDIDDLVAAGWIRVSARCSASPRYGTILHVYTLAADVGHRFIDRSGKQSRARLQALRRLVSQMDTSSAIWTGLDEGKRTSFDMWATSDQSSLYWMFNNIPSPAPCPASVSGIHRRRTMANLLSASPQSSSPRGLASTLYPFQRRSTALMLQREGEVELHLDARLERRRAPDESEYYYAPREFHFLRRPRQYEGSKGGILAETMGTGKTIIIISLILSTRGILPRIPTQSECASVSTKTPSLVDLCVRTAHKNSVPWRDFFDRTEEVTGDTFPSCTSRLQDSVYSYEVPFNPPRSKRSLPLPPIVKILAATTIIVVPRNLCSQWQAEISKHTRLGALDVLVMDDMVKRLPDHMELRTFDIVLFSSRRFEAEDRDGMDEQGRRLSRTPPSCRCTYIKATRKRHCTCLRPEDLYVSPLNKLHFLRVIIDEGHTFSSATSVAPRVAARLVTADHHWIVSGTPAKDLLGVEMDLYPSNLYSSSLDSSSLRSSELTLHDEAQRADILCQRKNFDSSVDSQGAIKSIGSMLSNFLQVKPWSGGPEDAANWEEHIYRHEHARRRTYSGFSTALGRTLEALVIRTRPEDVERDIELPPLTHGIVKLRPSYYDKITMNLFVLVLSANAITSERTDRDYIFHADSAKSRYQLITNLRQSAFFWTGFTIEDVQACVDICRKYLEKDDANCEPGDRLRLQDCIVAAEERLTVEGWHAMSYSHELGLFVRGWPQESAEHWSLREGDGGDPLLVGATQLHEAQDYVHRRLRDPDADLGLSGEGIRARGRARKANGTNKQLMTLGKKRSHANDGADQYESPTSKRQRISAEEDVKSSTTEESADDAVPALGVSSPLLHARLVGTASAKASYLLSQIIQHSAGSRMLIFYSGDNIAFYLAQCLEVLHVEHYIYTRSLTPAQKSDYVVRFQSRDEIRVMLMDVHQAAFGLNLTAADRVYFVNPVCNPAIEAQAIKRAHRIGQERQVKVETLVLEGGIEEAMFERARRMSQADHRRAQHLEDDGGIRAVIEQARLVDFTPDERTGTSSSRVAPLAPAQPIWTRPGWWEWSDGKWQGRGEQKQKTGWRGDEGDASG